MFVIMIAVLRIHPMYIIHAFYAQVPLPHRHLHHRIRNAALAPTRVVSCASHVANHPSAGKLEAPRYTELDHDPILDRLKPEAIHPASSIVNP